MAWAVLPPDMIQFSKCPTPKALANAIDQAIPRVKEVTPWKFHRRVKKMYDWQYVAHRTEIVYDRVREEPCIPFVERLRKYFGVGPFGIKDTTTGL